MLTFKFRGTVADVDQTVESDPITRVILPREVLETGKELLTVGQRIEVSGEVRDDRGGKTCVAWKPRPWRDQMH